jgi:FKBP-type peptidyl-prolyl cis-trans isomerase (trigger factor)
MKWEMVPQEDGFCRLRVQVPWEKIAPDYDDILNDYARLPLPGFRPGKAPRQIVEQRFRKEIAEELSRRGAPRLCRLALEQAEAQATGPVEVSEVEWEKGQTFRFTARFFPLPEFELPDYRSLRPLDPEGEDPHGELSHRLLELVDLVVPEEMVRGELAFEGQPDGEPESEAWQAAARRVKLMLILKRIAREEGIEVEEADVEQRIQEKAEVFGTKAETLRAELENGGGIPRLKDLLLAESTLEYLLETINETANPRGRRMT